MGQKVHPGGLRVGVIHDWKSNWWTGKKEIADYLLEDIRIRDHINGKLAHAGLSDILIRNTGSGRSPARRSPASPDTGPPGPAGPTARPRCR